jgi:Fic family protein
MNHRFIKRIEFLPPSVQKKIAEIDALAAQWRDGVQLDRQVLQQLKKSVLITSTGASTRIEGSQLSDEDVERLMRGIAMQKFKDRDQQEVRGYYELLTNVFDNYASIPLSESTIKFFHRELLKYTEKDALHRGEYKKKENKVMMVDAAGIPTSVIFDTAPAYLTPKGMQELVEWTQQALVEKRYHPLLLVGNFIVEFLNIHPFEDGNGRLSRILTNLLLLQLGYHYMPYVSHEKLIEDKKPGYYVALRQSQKTFGKEKENENIAAWMEFFLDILLDQSHQAIALLSNEQTDKLLSKQQQLVWRHIESTREATPLEIAKATGVPRPTINQALTKLLRLKRIERIGLGRSTRYRKI